MKKMRLQIFLILFISCLSLTAQVPYIEWAKCFGGTKNDQVAKIRQTKDLGYIVVGTTSSTDGDVEGNTNKESIWVLKLGVYGNIEWQRVIGSTSNLYHDDGVSVIQCKDGGYLVLGNTHYFDLPNDKVSHNVVRLTKLTAKGVFDWEKLYSHDIETGSDVIQTLDGGYILAGASFYSGTNNNSWDGIILSLDAIGNIITKGVWGGNGQDFFNAIVQKPGGGYCFLGSGDSNNGYLSGNNSFNLNYWIVEFNDSLKRTSSSHYGGCGDQYPRSIKVTPGSGYISAGSSSNDTCSNDTNFVQGNHGAADIWIIATDSLGKLKWQKSIGGSSEDNSYEIANTHNNGFVICGSTNSSDGDIKSNHGSSDGLIIKIDSSGQILWQKSLGGSDYEVANSIQQTSDGGYIVGGSTRSVDQDITGNHGAYDFWVVKLSAGGVGLSTVNTDLNLSFGPNPAKDYIIINSSFHDIGKCYIILDYLGKVIRKGNLLTERTQVDLIGITSGIYNIKIEGEKANIFKLIKID